MINILILTPNTYLDLQKIKSELFQTIMAEIMEVALSSVNLNNILSHHRIIETDYDHDHGGH